VLFLLSFGSIVVGYLFKDMFIGLGSNFFTQSIFIRSGSTYVNSDLTFHVIKLLPYFLVIISVVAVNYVFFYNIRPVTLSEVGIYSFFSYKWYFDVLYNKYLNIPLVQKSRVYLFDYGDKGLLEFFGPLSVENLLGFGHNSLKKFLISDVLLYGLFIVLIIVVAV
jgi:NADH-ubiquinone oxidoreductase chain 5